jgi:hypothetical protein
MRPSGADYYPATWTEAMTALDEYIDPLAGASNEPHNGSSFQQQRADGKTIPVRCFHCNKFGHKSNNCPEKADEASDSESDDKKGNSEKKG